MVPGTCEGILIPLLEQAVGQERRHGLRRVREPGVPARGLQRQGLPRATQDGRRPERRAQSADLVMALYEGLPGPRFQVPLGVAEMTKYVDNSFHALKVDFGNEIGAICAALGLDSHAGDGRLPVRHQAQPQRGLPAARVRVRRLLPAQGRPRPDPHRPPARHRDPDAVQPAGVERGAPPPGAGHDHLATASARSASSGSRSSPAPTTCARARWSSWPSGSSARATSCRSTTPTWRSPG